MVPIFVTTLLSAVPMLPVVSARKQISGLGGMVGVVTVLVTDVDPPGGRVAVTDGGETLADATAEAMIPTATRTNKSGPIVHQRLAFLNTVILHSF